MGELLLIWCALLALCVGLVWRTRGLGTLLLSYVLGLSLIHAPGALIYLGEAPGVDRFDETLAGFRLTLVGIGALLGGAAVALVWKAAPPATTHVPDSVDWRQLGFRFLVAGLMSFFFGLPLSALLPSFTSILSSFGSLLIIGIWMLLFDALKNGKRHKKNLILILLPALPFLTLIGGGFAGFGIYWLISILAFLFINESRRWHLIFAAPLVAWLGLSVGVAYFQERSLIREAVWFEKSSLIDRVDRIVQIGDSIELFSIDNPAHILPIEERLNQNILVGVGMDRLQSGAVEFLHGSSVPWWFFVPRAIWADKPAIGGGGTVVTQVTGIQFALGTSVGAGQPLEFYANFGWAGVVGGFLLLGYALTRLDLRLLASFRTGDAKGILFAGLPGLALLQPGGNLLEILVSVVAGMVAARALWFAMGVWGQPPQPPEVGLAVRRGGR